MERDRRLEAAYAKRRAVLGDEYVDRATGDADPASRAFQDFLTDTAWGVWTREGPLSTRDRSLIVLGMLAAMGRMEEFELHSTAAPNAGVRDEEIDELLYQIVAYCGAPAGVAARRILGRVRAARGTTR
ncbi:MAG: carboxymuconolactone decarboxylase family protein [Thermoleophilia bacterium]|nr:carboxymuconolactone decarboxylase family protein [Myxococcales bacterium]HPG24090.1 carboxymuconolactone decarboxylase family protein [Myxococcota bacterium]HPG24091.1 carboxymuconolactone decarboxylase family protein [Myxococcota bacterium]